MLKFNNTTAVHEAYAFFSKHESVAYADAIMVLGALHPAATDPEARWNLTSFMRHYSLSLHLSLTSNLSCLYSHPLFPAVSIPLRLWSSARIIGYQKSTRMPTATYRWQAVFVPFKAKRHVIHVLGSEALSRGLNRLPNSSILVSALSTRLTVVIASYWGPSSAPTWLDHQSNISIQSYRASCTISDMDL